MDGILILLALVALAIPISIIVLFVTQHTLRTRIGVLERRLAERIAAAPQAAAAPPEPRKPLPWERAPEAALSAPDAIKSDAAETAAPLTAPAAPITAQPEPDQNGPIVMRSERGVALVGWLRDNWVYVISAVSLALAGIFLVQYGIENGLLPPTVRVAMGLGFGAAMVGLGEWIRRRWGDGPESATAFLPSTFSGAGIVSMFAAVLAARQLYGLIGPEAALLGLVAVAGLAIVLGWFHGPFLVAVGLLGAAVAPFIVGGESDTPYWLYIYYLALSFAGLAVDAVRRWAWVSVLALAIGFGGTWMVWAGIGGAGWYALSLTLLVLLAIAVPVRQLVPTHEGAATLEVLARRRKDWPEFPARLAGGAMAVATLALVFMAGSSAADSMLAFLCLAGLFAAITLWAERAEALADLAILPAAGFLIRLIVEQLAWGPLAQEYSAGAIATRAPDVGAPMTVSVLLALAVVMSLAAAWRSFGGRSYMALWALAAALIGPMAGVLLEVFWAPREVMGAYPWALHALGLAGLMVVLAERFARRDGEDHRRAAYATLSALAMIAFALFVVTTKGALTLALAVLVVAAAALDKRFRLPEMSLFVQAGVVTLGYRLIVDPGTDWALEAALWEVFAAFGGAIGAMLAGLYLYRGMERRNAAVMLTSGLAGFAAVFANVLITRWANAQYGSFGALQHWVLSLNAMPWIVVMLVQLYRIQLGGFMRYIRGVIAAIAALFAAGLMLLSISELSPFYNAEPVQGPYVLDTLALAYALPGLLILAGLTRLGHLARALRGALAVTGVVLVVLYVVLEIRRYWQGDILSVPGVSQPELYTYTVALMLTGAGLLYQAIARRSAGLRRVAMAVIALTVAKVFFIDMSGLSGLIRVFSFLLLGLSLAGLALLNRWALQRQGGAEPEQAPEP